MDAVAIKEFAGDLFSGASALAGLILVFLGGVISSYDSFGKDAKFAVLARYRRNGALALGGFLTSLAAAVLALATKWWACPALLYAAEASLAIAFILILILAIMAFRGIN